VNGEGVQRSQHKKKANFHKQAGCVRNASLWFVSHGERAFLLRQRLRDESGGGMAIVHASARHDTHTAIMTELYGMRVEESVYAMIHFKHQLTQLVTGGVMSRNQVMWPHVQKHAPVL
jgi:hypothetical protein